MGRYDREELTSVGLVEARDLKDKGMVICQNRVRKEFMVNWVTWKKMGIREEYKTNNEVRGISRAKEESWGVEGNETTVWAWVEMCRALMRRRNLKYMQEERGSHGGNSGRVVTCSEWWVRKIFWSTVFRIDWRTAWWEWEEKGKLHSQYMGHGKVF